MAEKCPLTLDFRLRIGWILAFEEAYIVLLHPFSKLHDLHFFSDIQFVLYVRSSAECLSCCTCRSAYAAGVHAPRR